MGEVLGPAGPACGVRVPGLVFGLALVFRWLVEVPAAVWTLAGPSQQIPQVMQHIRLALQDFSAGQAGEKHSSHFTHLNDFAMAPCQ